MPARHALCAHRSMGEILWHFPNGSALLVRCTRDDNDLGLEKGDVACRVVSLDLV